MTYPFKRATPEPRLGERVTLLEPMVCVCERGVYRVPAGASGIVHSNPRSRQHGRPEWLPLVMDDPNVLSQPLRDMNTEQGYPLGYVELHCEDEDVGSWGFIAFDRAEALKRLDILRFYIACRTPLGVVLTTGAKWHLYSEWGRESAHRPGFLALTPDGEGVDDADSVVTVCIGPDEEEPHLTASIREPGYPPLVTGAVETRCAGLTALAVDFEILASDVDMEILKRVASSVAVRERGGVGHMFGDSQKEAAALVRAFNILERDTKLYIATARSYLEQQVLPYMGAKEATLSVLDAQTDRPNHHRQAKDTQEPEWCSTWVQEDGKAVCAACYGDGIVPDDEARVDAALARLDRVETEALALVAEHWNEVDARNAAGSSWGTKRRMAARWLAIRTDGLPPEVERKLKAGRCELCGERKLCDRCTGLK